MFSIESPAFADKAVMPVKYTGEGANISPPLKWNDVPKGTKTLALIVDDPDAPDPQKPERTFVHWVMYNISPDTRSVHENLTRPPKGAAAGNNDYKHTHWDGPRPPTGQHRYFYKLYALDTSLYFKKPPTKAELETAMKGHILASAEMVGLYEKRH